MIDVCFGSFYLTYLIASLMKNTLFFIGIRYSKGNIKMLLGINVIFEIIILMTLPLFMLITKGSCA